MKSVFFIVIAIIFPGYSLAQLHVSLSTGLAGFSMQDMKKHQQEVKVQMPTDVKMIESFPDFWFYELSLTGRITERMRIGGAIGFTSTGARMDYRDYSGEVECNQVTTAWNLAGMWEVLLNFNKKWLVYFTTKSGVSFGHYDLDLLIKLDSDQDSDHVEFNSKNFFIEPGFLVSKRIFGPLNVNLSAGYNINAIKGKQRLSGNSDLFLQNNSGSKVSLDWSGFRMGAGLSVAF